MNKPIKYQGTFEEKTILADNIFNLINFAYNQQIPIGHKNAAGDKIFVKLNAGWEEYAEEQYNHTDHWRAVHHSGFGFSTEGVHYEEYYKWIGVVHSPKFFRTPNELATGVCYHHLIRLYETLENTVNQKQSVWGAPFPEKNLLESPKEISRSEDDYKGLIGPSTELTRRPYERSTWVKEERITHLLCEKNPVD
jgi:hypothetical protein